MSKRKDEAILHKHSYGSEFTIEQLPDGCEETSMGWLFGATRQWRGPDGLHVREYGGRLLAHYDRVDPRRNLVGHWIADAPFELALGSSGVVGMLASVTVSAASTLAWIVAALVTTVSASIFARTRF